MLAEASVGAGGQTLARGFSTGADGVQPSLNQVLVSELEDMCQDDDEWQWQGDQYWEEEESEWKT